MPEADRKHLVCVFAPIGRDAAACADLLSRSGIVTIVCSDFSDLVRSIKDGADAVFVAEEGLFGQNLDALTSLVSSQAAWSDLPFLVLTSRQDTPAVVLWRQGLASLLRNVSFIERPVRPFSLTSAVKAALRARDRQHEVRALLSERERAATELERLVAERTLALEAANAELRAQMAERARVEETLRQAQKIEAIGQLTGGVAHDFNNLLMVITGGLEMLQRNPRPERRERLLRGMQQAALRGAGLTRQLLAFSRRQELKPVSLDVALQIGGLRELLDRSLRGDVHVVFNFPEDLWPIEVDPGELELVTLNLAVNARDAMPQGGVITIQASNQHDLQDEKLFGDFVRLSFIDTGTGMPPEVQARVFEPFFTTKEIGKGSGLGLAQVHGFATQSGGAVRIQSEKGVGTTIELYLPRAKKSPANQERRHLVDLHVDRDLPTRAGCILLVEDDDEVAELVNDMLKHLGYEVVRAASAAAALGALADSRQVDLVLSDIMMPGGMNGVELAREIKRRRGDLPIMLTSGYAEASRSAAEAEGISILPKPYSLEDLDASLARLRHSGSFGSSH
jgi:signal transduction histidine kinase/CheY-like chemotaxis protein